MFSIKMIFVTFALISQLLGVDASCPNLCSGNGECDKFSRCHCTRQYEGADCSLRVCPKGPAWNDIASGQDQAHALATCSNRGICDTSSGICTCAEGFVGAACERLDCFASCTGYGNCMSLYDLAKYTRDDLSQSFSYETIWDAHQINGCVCDPQYYGYDCSLRKCPDGDDPLTTGQENTIQLVRCVANTGSFVLFFDGYPSKTIQWSASANEVKNALEAIPYITRISVEFSQTSGTVCQTDTNIVKIEFLNEFSELSPFVPLMDDVMSVNGQVSISADGVGVFSDVDGSSFVSVVGTKEADPCANRGVCSTADGTCLCFATNGDTYGSSDGYGAAGTRGDCGFITSGSTVSTCPGGIQCSAHGVCETPSYRCSCSDGWTGGDCSERLCPSGLSWFSYPSSNEVGHSKSTICSDMGICDPSTGTCVCRNGFYGSACQYMGCGGGLTTPCNGHGQCLSMQELSLNSKLNGELQPITYGVDPNNPYTWDGYRIMGCMCDEGHQGYDCSLKTCPIGDDPGTYNDHNEVQLLNCIADSGTFTLTFRDAVTEPIPSNVTSKDLAKILSALPTVQKVTVTYILDGPPPHATLSLVQPPFPVTFEAIEFALYKNWLATLNVTNQTRFNDTKTPDEPNPANDNTTISTTVVEPVPETWNIDGTALCNTTGKQTAIIAFDIMTGDLPPIRTDNSLLTDFVNGNGLAGTGTLTIYTDGETVNDITSIKGTTETAICNNRGVCNTITGVCECFDTWVSSDGDGNPGNTGDCAFRMDETGINRGIVSF